MGRLFLLRFFEHCSAERAKEGAKAFLERAKAVGAVEVERLRLAVVAEVVFLHETRTLRRLATWQLAVAEGYVFSNSP